MSQVATADTVKEVLKDTVASLDWLPSMIYLEEISLNNLVTLKLLLEESHLISDLFSHGGIRAFPFRRFLSIRWLAVVSGHPLLLRGKSLGICPVCH